MKPLNIILICCLTISFSINSKDKGKKKIPGKTLFEAMEEHGLKELFEEQKYINMSSSNVSNIDGISQFKGLKKLFLLYNPIRDFKEIAKLQDLEVLDLSWTYLKDISPLKNLNKLKELSIYGTFVKDVTDLPLSIQKLHLDKDVKTEGYRKRNPNCKIYSDPRLQKDTKGPYSR